MVLEGQYLERATLIARDAETTLEGLYHRGAKAPALVVCAPHPRLGGSMDSPVVAELAWAVTRRAHASLRFNYQGVGASMGALSAASVLDRPNAQLPISLLETELGDVDAAVRHLRETVPHGRVVLAGYSFGAAVALRHALTHPDIAALVLVSPPTGMFDFSALAAFDRPLLVAAGHQDTYVDRPKLSEWVQASAAGRFEVLVGSDHTFTRGLTELGRLVAAFVDVQ